MKTDTSKPYFYTGYYCLIKKKDTMSVRNSGTINFNLFDGINGKTINEGTIWIVGFDTSKVIFSETNKSIIIPLGEYSITASNPSYLALKTKKIRIKSNQKISVNFYLGNSYQR